MKEIDKLELELSALDFRPERSHFTNLESYRPFARAFADEDQSEVFAKELELPWVGNTMKQMVETALIDSDIAKGIRDENKLTDNVFFVRHPERRGKKIAKAEPLYAPLSREWLAIRDKLVRPKLLAGKNIKTYEDASHAVGENLGVAMMKPGKIARPTWSLRAGPGPADKVIATLTLNENIFIERDYQRTGEKLSWYSIYTSTGQSGWVRSDGVALNPPEPGAEIHYVNKVKVTDQDKEKEKNKSKENNLINIATNYYKGGGFKWGNEKDKDKGKENKENYLINIAAKYYKGDGFKWGQDARFFVMAIAFANTLAKRTAPFINLPQNDAEWQQRDKWENIGVKEESAIWIPSKEFLQTLASKVSSGSITYELWKRAKKVVKDIVDWVKFAASFIAGLIQGALESVYDLLMEAPEMVKIVWSVIKSLFTGSVVRDAKQLYEAIKEAVKQIDPAEIGAEFMGKWDHEDPWDKGLFRGRVLGYTIVEALLMIFSVGAIIVAKWGGKFAKVMVALMKLENVAGPGAAMVNKIKTMGIKMTQKLNELLPELVQARIRKLFPDDRDGGKVPSKKSGRKIYEPKDAEILIHDHLLTTMPSKDWKKNPRFLDGQMIDNKRRDRNSTEPDSYSKHHNLAVEVKSHPPDKIDDMIKVLKDNQMGGRYHSLPQGTRQWLYWVVKGYDIEDLDRLGDILRNKLRIAIGPPFFERLHIVTDNGTLKILG
jgi:hypothetical protein